MKRLEGRSGASGSIYEIEVEELQFYKKKIKIMKKKHKETITELKEELNRTKALLWKKEKDL